MLTTIFSKTAAAINFLVCKPLRAAAESLGLSRKPYEELFALRDHEGIDRSAELREVGDPTKDEYEAMKPWQVVKFKATIRKRRSSAVKKLAEYQEACEAERLYEEECELSRRADFMPRKAK